MTGMRILYCIASLAGGGAERRMTRIVSGLVARGHEVGNHSFEHESWLHLYTREQLTEEIINAENAIAAVCSQRPRGFRGPGYSWSETLLEVLAARDYLFDASTLPTYLGPLARAYYFATAGKAIAQLENTEPLMSIRRISVRGSGENPEFQQVSLTADSAFLKR